jgi:manganese transport protein
LWNRAPPALPFPRARCEWHERQQVILSFQLSFAVVPLVLFTGSRTRMGEFVNGRSLQALAWITAALIAGLNAWLLVQTFLGNS